MRLRRNYLYKNHKMVLFMGLLLGVMVIIFFIYMMTIIFSTERKVEKVVERFYQYEQNGDFSNSWEMFHSSMKNRFDKSSYIQDRAHVFLEHFGVNTFDFWLTDPSKVKNDQINTELTSDQTIYRLVVTYVYQSKYGYLEIKQPVLITQEDKEWKILWEYEET